MSETPPFREEALLHHRRQRGPGSVLRVGPRWTRWAFWALVALAAAALLAAGLVRVDRERFVPAALNGQTVRAFVPADVAARVSPGDDARVAPAGGEAMEAVVLTVGTPGAGGAPPGTVLLNVRAARPLRARTGVLRLRVGRRSLLRDLVPGLSP